MKIMHGKKIFIVALLGLLCSAPSALAREYWIDPLNGKDTNDGSQTSPKLSLSSSALRAALRPGDTVLLMDTAVYAGNQGFYTSGSIGVDGTESQPITIAAAPGARPIFKGCGQYQVYLTLARQWYVIDGLTFEVPDNPAECAQPVTVGILLQGNNNVIKNSAITSIPVAGIRIDRADNNRIQGNTASNIGNVGGGFGNGEFVTIRGGQNNIVQNNTVHGAGHAAIGIYDYPNLVRLSSNNQILDNTIDQGAGNGGGGGIYVQVQSHHNLVQGNIISNVGQMPGITQPKAGIDITAPNNTIRDNRIESYGVRGSERHRGIFLNSTTGFNNLHADNNLFEGNIIGAGYGIPVYVREGIGTRAAGATVASNVFKGNTITAPIDALTGGDYIGAYNPTGKYLVYLGSYQDGAWPEFANGNIFVDNMFVHAGDGLIGYFYGTGGFGKSVPATFVDFPSVFYETSVDVIAPATPTGLSVQ